MWIDTRDCVPLMDGTYMVQTVTDEVTTMDYTAEGGWNTYYDRVDGKLQGEDLDPTGVYIVKWYKLPAPQKVTKERYNEWMVQEVTR